MLDDQLVSRFRTACQDADLWKRVQPFAGLVRLDSVEYPVVVTTGSVFVTAGTDRRSTGTHYTPKSLTEPIVQYTLEPLVYIGPADGLPKEQWKLRSAKELLGLKICDMACGSGAFLVQACRYMAVRLLEAWDAVQRANPCKVQITPEGEPSTGQPGEMLIPDDLDERQTYALRIVAQRCLYGVDINPLAVEMAKLSLWLLTLAKDKPFEFLDHAIRCGDSLVGIHNIEQLRKFNLDGKGVDNNLFLQFLDPKIKEAIALRRQITEMQANTVEDVEQQDRLLREANEKIDRLKCAADFLIAAEFTPGSASDKRRARDDAAIKVAIHFNDSDLPTFRREAQKALAGQVTFHWPLEFPEVMVERGGFDGFVGNPPFMGGQKLSGEFSGEYREYLVSHLAQGQRGSADLCAYFFLRVWELLRTRGAFALLATNTIAQGDTRQAGLDQIAKDSGITFRAERSRPWPGNAAVMVAVCHVFNGDWNGVFNLDGEIVGSISSSLDAVSWYSMPFQLAANSDQSFKGTEVYGIGFVISPEQAQELISADSRNRRIIKPYLDGQTVNSSPDTKTDRWVIDFAGMSEQEAASYSACFSIVVREVKPQRTALASRNASGSSRAKQWWRFSREVVELYEALKGREKVLVVARVSRTAAFVFVDANQILNEMLVVFLSPRFATFSTLQSSIHVEWCWTYSSTLKGDLRYSQTDCFETYPLPPLAVELDKIGEVYHGHRQSRMLSCQEGLTKTYNRFHNPEETSADIQRLRQLHAEMDNAVSAAYGWTGLDLGHGFHPTKQGVRYTISEPARREVLARLLKLNHERYAEEVKQGLHEKKKSRNTRKSRKKSEEEGGLFE